MLYRYDYYLVVLKLMCVFEKWWFSYNCELNCYVLLFFVILCNEFGICWGWIYWVILKLSYYFMILYKNYIRKKSWKRKICLSNRKCFVIIIF